MLLKYLRGFGWLGICSIIDKRVNDREQMNIQGEVMQVCLANFIQFLSNQSKIFKTCNQYFIIHISFNQKSWRNYIKNSHITTHSLYFTMNFLICLCYYSSVHVPIIQMTIAVRIILAFFFLVPQPQFSQANMKNARWHWNTQYITLWETNSEFREPKPFIIDINHPCPFLWN